jgi:subtilisin family serine protease
MLALCVSVVAAQLAAREATARLVLDPDLGLGVLGAASALVAFDDGVTESEARTAARAAGLDDGLWIAPLRTLEVTSEKGGLDRQSISGVFARADVRFLEPNPAVFAADVPDDTAYEDQWSLPLIGAEDAWDVSAGTTDVVIAVLDTGINLSHAEFEGKLVEGWDFINDDANPSDDNGHGTHVAGIVGAATNNATGVASIGRDTSLMPVKVLTQYSGGNHATTASGVTWAVDNGADILNLSLGSSSSSQTLEDAIDYAASHGVVVVGAAGNGNTSSPFYPAAYESVIAVGATDANDERYSSSNYGAWLDVMAPGVSIYSTNWGPSEYNTRTGTSQAAPHVAGLVGLMLAANPDLTPTDVAGLIMETAADLGDEGTDDYFGHGRIAAAAAVSAAQDAEPSDPTATPVPPTATPVPPTATPLPPTATPLPSATPTAAPIAVGPVISSVRIVRLENRSFKVAWNTDIPATTQLEWGLTSSYGNLTTLNESLVKKHAVRIAGLQRQTTYHYRVRSIAGGVEAISGGYTVTTK